MVHLVGTTEYFPCPARVREFSHDMLEPHVTYCSEGTTTPRLHHEMQIRLTGNIVAPSSVWALMLAFRQQLRITYPLEPPLLPPTLLPLNMVLNDNVRERAVNLAGVVPFPTTGDLRDHGETGAMATTTGKHVRFTTGATRTSNSKWRLHKGRPEPYPTVVRRPLSAVAAYKVDAATAKYLQ